MPIFEVYLISYKNTEFLSEKNLNNALTKLFFLFSAKSKHEPL